MAYEEQDYVDGWRTYSDWIDNIRNSNLLLEEYVVKSNLKEKLLSSKTNLDRFSTIWKDDLLRNEIASMYRLDLQLIEDRLKSRSVKSVEQSKCMRELGNKFFKNGEFMEALKHYTEAIRFAPYPSTSTNNLQHQQDDSLALGLANRSAALYSLTRYRLCLLDIDLAIKYGYPANNMFKLLIRKVKCLHILSVWANDVEQIKDNLKQILKTRDTKEFIKTEIINMFDFIEQTQPEDLEKDELDIVDETTMKISNLSKTLTQAADCIEMSFDSEKGRYLITNKDISYGRLLIAEEPFVCNLAPSKRNSYCYNCFAGLYSCGIGCSSCTQVLFCSEECLNAKIPTHRYECSKFLEFQSILGVAYLVSHIMFKINFNLTSIPIYTKKIADKKTLDDVLNIPTSDWPDLVYKNEYSSMLSLMDHAEDYDFDELLGFSITATYLVIAFCDNFSYSCPSLNEKQTQLIIGSVVLKHLMQLQTNLISILDQNLHNLTMIGHTLSEVNERPIGVGVYPTISLLNHSCKPNILSFFHKNKFVARAASSLECGTEINYCYGPSVNRMSKKDRIKRLKEQYFFDCSCECCSNNQENESRALLCPQCQGPVIYNQDFSHKCLTCHATEVVDVKESIQKLDSFNRLFANLEESNLYFEQKLVQLKELETNLKKVAFWKNPLFARIKSEQIDCATNYEDSTLALEYCNQELRLCERMHGKDSYESLVTMLKLINLKWQMLYYAIEDSTLIENKEEKVKDLRSLILTINETRGKLKDLLTSTNIMGAESSFETELKFLSDTQTLINKYLAEGAFNKKTTQEEVK